MQTCEIGLDGLEVLCRQGGWSWREEEKDARSNRLNSMDAIGGTDFERKRFG